MLFKTREVGKSVMSSPHTEGDAAASRNSFTSNYYDRLFSWLVKRLNLTIIPQEDLRSNNIRYQLIN
jgi:myosin heavy subunit